MPRVKKQLVELISKLSPKEIEQIRAKLLAPKLGSLRRERAKLVKRLREVRREIARLGAPVKRRRVRVRRARRARKGTMASKIKAILGRAKAPMRVKNICAALVRSGVPRKKGLVNYVNRTLSTNPLFAKAGWGLYRLAGQAPAAPVKRAPRKKAEPAAAAK